ncbi:hypothetical protein OC834_000540 [Tilletia horrida]|nr:hypothetical protein OC834_000540 [Tilletia horrida]
MGPQLWLKHALAAAPASVLAPAHAWTRTASIAAPSFGRQARHGVRWQSTGAASQQEQESQQQPARGASRAPASMPAPAQADSPSPALRDLHNRQHTYLRISLTERCNLRCLYCMPEEGVALTPSDKLLSQTEIARLGGLFVREGVSKIRLTGGEPTLRADLLGIVESLNELRPLGLRQIGLTSNGIALHRKLPALARAGLTHLNLSLDTLDPFKFEFMTRRRGMDAVMRSLETALELGMESIKLNVVVLKGLNDEQDVLDFVHFTRDRPVAVRFIEYMPFDGNKWQMGKLVTYRQLLDRIQHKFGPLERLQDDDNDTSKGWRVPGFAGSIGFITRLRITADGNLKVCLFGNAEVSLRDAMRGTASTSPSSLQRTPATDEQLLDVISAAVKRKHARHAGYGSRSLLARRGMQGGRLTLRSPSNVPAALLSATPAFSSRYAAIRSFASRSVLPQRKRVEGPSAGTNLGNEVDVDDLSDLDFSYEPYFERLGPPPAHLQGPRQSAPISKGFPSSSAVATRTAVRSSAQTASSASAQLTHVDPADRSRARMVDVSDKIPTLRTGTAVGRVYLPQVAMDLIRASEASNSGEIAGKGPVLRTAQLAGIMGAKRTADLIPLCHPLSLTHVDVVLELVEGEGEEEEQRETRALQAQMDEERAALASSEAFLRQATSGAHTFERADGDSSVQSQEDVGFRIEDLIDADQWRGRELDLNELGGNGGGGGLPAATFNTASPSASLSRSPDVDPARERLSSGMGYVQVTCTARTSGPTGVEMEALIGANIACLTVWDMVKAVAGREMWIGDVKVVKKTGGKSGDWEREL